MRPPVDAAPPELESNRFNILQICRTTGAAQTKLRMRTPASRSKKSSGIKPRRKVGAARRAVRARKVGAPKTSSRDVPAFRRAKAATTKIALRREFRVWKESLPTALERDTLLVPEWTAESVVQEVERFLGADLPEDFTARLAAKAEYLYPRHAQFKKMLNRRGNAGREQPLCVHAALDRKAAQAGAFHALQKLPRSFGLGQALPTLKNSSPDEN
jgi:hypothetical protein